ncbi:MAG TPA: 6-phosphogluconolactonase [Thermoanaerobaculia bacterium]
MNLRIFDSSDDLAAAAARTIEQRLAGRQTAVVGVSGGSTPRRLYEVLNARKSLASTAVTWIVVDERFVPEDDPQSNAAAIGRTLFGGGLPASHRFLRFDTSLADAAQSASAFESDWQRMRLDRLDVVILGCGEDGHTASLFPGTPVLDVEDRIASEVFVPRLDQWRVTLTFPIIRAAALRIVLATGASKAAVLREVREGADLPIVRATEGGETWWFVDREAAG